MKNEKRKINIVLVEYINRNLGDTVIAECSKYLLTEALNNNNFNNYVIHEYNMYNEDMEYIRKADLIIFAGGGLVKFKREKIYYYVCNIIDEADKYNIPVFINCTGVEGYDVKDERSIMLKNALNKSCVKGITVRDDFDTLIKNYITDKKEWIQKVYDPAVFSGDLYKVARNKESNIIGLGVVRYGLFEDYGSELITKKYQLEFWLEIIINLEKAGYEWQIFTNGLHEDYCAAMELLEYLGLDDSDRYIAKRPAEGLELVKIISEYKGIIAPRLHANIIAYSLSVPSIGLVWNEKLKQFGETIGYPERFIYPENMNAVTVMETLQKAVTEGCIKNAVEEKNKILNSLEGFVSKYGKLICVNDHIHKDINYKKYLVANALGGRKYQYCGMNSGATFEEKYEEGYKWYEVDLKLTSDKKLVCVNGWNKSTYDKLGLKIKDNAQYKDITYCEFMNCGYYNNHYPVMDYEMLLQYFDRHPEVKVVFDIRNNEPCEFIYILDMLEKSIKENRLHVDKVVIRLLTSKEINIIKSHQIFSHIKIMYDIPSYSEQCHMDIELSEIEKNCMDESVDYISVRKNTPNLEKIISGLNKIGKKICIFNCNTLTEVNFYIQNGVSLVSSDYLNVNKLNYLN